MKKSLIAMALCLMIAPLTACGGGDTPTPPTPPTPEEEEFKDAYFNSLTVDYDEKEHILAEVGGVPEGTKIDYNGRLPHIDVGTYEASAILSKEGYKTKTLYATLTIKGQEFKNVYFDDVIVKYNGEEHVLGEVRGAPEDTNITYTGRDNHTDAGTYTATATLSKKGYNTKILTATLTITKAEFEGLTYDNATATYDGTDHIHDVKLVGSLPESAVVTETVKDSFGQQVKEAINVGTYNYHVKVTDKNYETYEADATLIIKKQRTDMPVFVSSDGTISFANGLDSRFVYSLKTDGTLKRIDYSTPKKFNKYSPSKALFIAGSPLLNAVKEIDGDSTSVIYTDSNIDDFVKYNDVIYYYSSNSITSSKSGIYQVDASDSESEPIVTRIFEGKTDNLGICGNNLYFINKSDHDYIYKIDLPTGTSSLVLNEKVHEFTLSSDNKLYCTVNGTFDDYIGYIDLTSSTPEIKRLTIASGEFLTIKNNKLYYNYTDLFGVIDPSNYGIWSIDLNSLAKTPEHILTTENVNGFDVESDNSLVYIDTTNLHLYRYNTSTKVKTDLLSGFVPPEVVPINTGGHTVAYGNRIYYLNMYAGKTLYVYDEETKKSNQLTTNKVEDFFIYEDKLYFNQVTMLINNDLYCVDLKVSSEAVKINNNDVRNMISDGTYIYATHYSWAEEVLGARGLSRMKLDGTEYIKFSDVNGAKNLTIRDNKLYFINCGTAQDNGNIEYIDLSKIDPNLEEQDLERTNLSKNIKNVKQFIFDNDNIFYIYNGSINNSIRRTDFASLSEGVEIASAKTNPNEMILKGNDIYYYSHPLTLYASYSGFYKVAKDAPGDETYVLIHGYEEKYYGSDFAILGSNLYFLNYIPKLLLGDAHTYQLNLETKVITKIA